MKHLLVLATVLSLCLVPLALAQHGHGGGMGNSGMGNSGMGAEHGNMGSAHDNSAGGNGSSPHGGSINDVLSHNSAIAGNIQSLTGKNATDACQGFKNLGQCVAAAHVSKNLGISFACLKADMTGVPAASSDNCPANSGSKSMSLGKAIQTLDPKADSKQEAAKANRQAQEDLKNSSPSS